MKQLKKDIHEMKEIEKKMSEQMAANRNWQVDRRISIPTLLQLGAVVVFGVTFYNNQVNNQMRNEERFSQFADERKANAAALLEQQKTTQEMLLELTKINERENYITDTLKDLTATVKARSPK